MSAIMEKELNTVYCGNGSAGTMLGGPKFNVGDRVMAKSAPEGGVGTVVKSQYNEGRMDIRPSFFAELILLKY